MENARSVGTEHEHDQRAFLHFPSGFSQWWPARFLPPTLESDRDHIKFNQNGEWTKSVGGNMNMIKEHFPVFPLAFQFGFL